MNGYIQVYTGNGKGKTTAALGLSLRAAAAGLKVYIGQFVKGMHYSEMDLLPLLPNITLKQYGRGCFIYSQPTQEDYAAAQNGLSEMALILQSGNYDLVVLDEINIALYFKLFPVEDVIEGTQGSCPQG